MLVSHADLHSHPKRVLTALFVIGGSAKNVTRLLLAAAAHDSNVIHKNFWKIEYMFSERPQVNSNNAIRERPLSTT